MTAMSDDTGFLRAIKSRPSDRTARLVYADWLDERGDPRGDFVRLHLALGAAAPDHVERVAGENELSQLRKGCSASWLAVVEPERAPPDAFASRRLCGCFEGLGDQMKRRTSPYFHIDAQDTECDPWKRLLDEVEEAAADGRAEFSPLDDMSGEDRAQILTLPPTVAKLKAVKWLNLYGSCLVRIPPEVGEMTSLEGFDPYTSYRLHWFPYELTRCKVLQGSRVSTRALYGNYKHRPQFPRLHSDAEVAAGRSETIQLPLKRLRGGLTRPCNVCGAPFEDRRQHRLWISLRVATDVLPLLVNACSAECVGHLPSPPEGYVAVSHKGGPDVKQPSRR